MSSWSWHQHPDTWTAYEPALSARLEAHLASGAPGVLSVQLGPARTSYTLDVDSMEQTNAATGFVRRIRREPSAALRGCACWEWDGGAAVGWVRYDEQAAQQLELARAAGRQCTCLMAADCGYSVDLAAMEQRNERTHFRRAVRRLAAPAVGGPAAPATPLPWPAQHAAAPRAPPAAAPRTPPAAAARVGAGAELSDLEGELHFTSHDGQLELAKLTDWRLLLPPEYDPSAECAITCCAYGQERDDPVVRLSCGCAFNRSTAERALLHKPQCPLCHFQFAELLGAMPSGRMAVWREAAPCEGHEGCGSFALAYSFPPGLQGPQHPEPGNEYHGTERRCYVPDTPAGRRTVRLLREAFRRGLTFKVGTSVTSGRSNAVTWAIHHKTSRAGGTACYGYPDPTYDARCAAECAALGLMLDEEEEERGAGGAEAADSSDAPPAPTAAGRPKRARQSRS